MNYAVALQTSEDLCILLLYIDLTFFDLGSGEAISRSYFIPKGG